MKHDDIAMVEKTDWALALLNSLCEASELTEIESLGDCSHQHGGSV